jgi:signal transduction histidine kinase/HAMP domain-containing protein
MTMITSTVTLLLAGAAYVTYDLVTFRRAMTRDLLILAEIIGTNSTGALAFDDPKAGAATLASLQAEEHIVSACLYVKGGTLFAAYHRGGAWTAGDECRLSGTGHLAVARPIVFDGDAIGTISIESDLRAFYSRLMRYASIGVVVMLASSVVGWLLSIQLQRVISGPMLDLVQTARTVSDRMDYSVRAVKRTEDEVGLLIDSFNQMLTQIEKRDAALTTLSNNLNQLYRLSTAMQEPLSLREHLTRVLEAARQVVAIDRFYVWALAPGGDRVSALAGAGFATDEWKDFENTEIPLVEAGAMYKAYLEGAPLVFNEENPLPRELRLRPPYAELQAIRTTRFIVIPMIARGQTVGLFTADNKRSREPILSSTVDLLQIFVSHAAVAIENARLFHEIEDKGRQLEMASRHKSQFLANMSHELRTPLNAVLGYTELILDNIFGEVPPQIRDTLERTRSSGLHLLGLINDVLDLSKIEAGHLVLSLGEYSMGEVVHTAVSSLRSLAEEKQLALKSLAAPDLPPGKGDERRIAQVVLNLVGNAIKFTEVGQVTVEATAADGSFVVSVSDTGSGISPVDQQKIFEEFQQADSSSTRKKGGTGLGLSIARRIIALHGGRIWVESSPGHGSTFRFTLPVRVEAQEESR